MDLSLLPWWAILYLILLLINGAGTIYISGSRSPLYILGELLSTLFAISFFLIYYGVVPYPASVWMPLGMVGWILFQEIWVNRYLYDLITVEGLPEKEHKQMLLVIPAIFILFLAPFFWVVLQVFKHYFLY